MRALLRLIFSLACFAVIMPAAFAQEEIDQLLTENISDANKLITAYANPFMKSLTLGMNQGWYNTAKPHKIVGVDLTFTVNAMTIPTGELFYEPGKLGLQQVSLATTSTDYPKAPTIFGPENDPTFKNNSSGTTFTGPGGLDLKGNFKSNWIPVPMAQLGIGLPKNTDLKIRFVPTIHLGDASTLKVIGFGVMHDVKQWIPGIKLLPFDLSAFVGYTKLSLESAFDAQSIQGQNQKGVFNLNATTIQGVISKKISVITFYGGLGYNIAKSNLGLKGTYDLNKDGDTNDAGEKNPIDLNFAASGARATAGFRLKLAVLTIHADYTVQQYKCLSIGLGISVR